MSGRSKWNAGLTRARQAALRIQAEQIRSFIAERRRWATTDNVVTFRPRRRASP